MEYTPIYTNIVGQGIFSAINCPGGEIIASGDPTHPLYVAWATWVQAAYPTAALAASQALWLAANPWQAWGDQTLAQYQAQQIAQLKSDCDALVLAHYPQTNQTAMVVMLMQAAQQGLANRAAYLEQVWTWATAITTLYYQQAAAISSCATQAQVQSVSWIGALAILATQDPNVTIQQAMSIGN